MLCPPPRLPSSASVSLPSRRTRGLLPRTAVGASAVTRGGGPVPRSAPHASFSVFFRASRGFSARKTCCQGRYSRYVFLWHRHTVGNGPAPSMTGRRQHGCRPSVPQTPSCSASYLSMPASINITQREQLIETAATDVSARPHCHCPPRPRSSVRLPRRADVRQRHSPCFRRPTPVQPLSQRPSSVRAPPDLGA